MSEAIGIYDFSIPLLVRNFEVLSDVLDQGAKWAKDNNKDAESLLHARIIDDMNPLAFQIKTCCNTAQQMLPVVTSPQIEADKDRADNSDEEPTTLAAAKARIAYTVKLLRSLRKSDFVEACHPYEMPIPAKYGAKIQGIVQSPDHDADSTNPASGHLPLTALTYVQKYVVPTFFFHQVMVYAILRKEGAPVGKFDYLGAKDLVGWSL